MSRRLAELVASCSACLTSHERGLGEVAVGLLCLPLHGLGRSPLASPLLSTPFNQLAAWCDARRYSLGPWDSSPNLPCLKPPASRGSSGGRRG